MDEQVSLADLATFEIERISRAIVSQLSPALGSRATGTVRVVATGADVTLPPNTYLVPVLSGTARENMLHKVWFNPTTRLEHQTGGEWTVTSAGLNVDVRAQVGGIAGNIPPGTRMRFEPPIEGIQQFAVSGPAFTGGDNAGPLKQVVIFDELEGQTVNEFLRGGMGMFPSLALAWIRSTPREGTSTGNSQGASRKMRNQQSWWESFAAYIAVSSEVSLDHRRRQGTELVEIVRGILQDRRRNDDGEMLSTDSTGVQILEARRLTRTASSNLYQVVFRTATTRKRPDPRVFNPWLETRFKLFNEAVPPTVTPPDPGLPETVLADFIDEMPTE